MFELLATNPLSPVGTWLGKEFERRLGAGYQLCLDGQDLPTPDLALLRMYAGDGQLADLSMKEPNGSLKRAQRLISKGVRVINPPVSHYITDDKLMSAAILRSADTPTPLCWDAHHQEGEVFPASHGWIVKPRRGELGIDVTLYENLSDALGAAKDKVDPQIIQHYLPNSRCVRVIASKDKVYTAYEKWMPDNSLVAAIALGGERKETDPNELRIGEPAKKAIHVCQADFVGVDILISEGKPYVLELNISPGGLPSLSPSLQDEILDDLTRI